MLSLLSSSRNPLPMPSFGPHSWSFLSSSLISLSCLSLAYHGQMQFPGHFQSTAFSLCSELFQVPLATLFLMSTTKTVLTLGAAVLSIYTSHAITFNSYSFSVPLLSIQHKILSKCLSNFPI